jgi:hypothetical protein
VEPVLGAARTGELVHAIQELPQIPDLDTLTRLLRTGDQES